MLFSSYPLFPLITVTNTDSRTQILAFVYFCSPTRKDDWLLILLLSLRAHAKLREILFMFAMSWETNKTVSTGNNVPTSIPPTQWNKSASGQQNKYVK